MENLDNIQPIPETEISGNSNLSALSEPSDNPGSSDNSEPSEISDLSDNPEVRRLIEEAEQRGYIRGRNEQIEQVVMQPLDDDPTLPPAYSDSDSCPSFLANIRPSIWD